MGMGTWGCFLLFSFFQGLRELKAKRGGVLGREEREAGASLLHPFSFPFPFFFSFFLFFCSVFFLRNEMKRNEAMRELFFFYERFGDVSKKRISDNLYIRNSTSFIYIIFNNSLLRLRVTGKLYPGTCKLSLSFFMSVPRSSDEESKRGGGIIIYGTRSIYTYIYIY